MNVLKNYGTSLMFAVFFISVISLSISFFHNNLKLIAF